MSAAGRGIVLALGGGGARGLAHVGVLEVLSQAGIPIRAICGTSIGAEIGAFFAKGMTIPELVRVASQTTRRKTFQLFRPDLAGGGIASGRHIVEFLHGFLGESAIEDLPLPFAAVATDLESGQQVVLDRGPLSDAVRASVSVPGVLAPARIGGRLVVDGGLVNPLPADVARERFGGPVVAVAVHCCSELFTQSPIHAELQDWHDRIRQFLRLDEGRLRLHMVVEQAADIMQNELVRLRLANCPPDVLLEPDCRGIGVLEFHHGKAAIAAGREAATRSLPAIRRLIGRP